METARPTINVHWVCSNPSQIIWPVRDIVDIAETHPYQIDVLQTLFAFHPGSSRLCRTEASSSRWRSKYRAGWRQRSQLEPPSNFPLLSFCKNVVPLKMSEGLLLLRDYNPLSTSVSTPRDLRAQNLVISGSGIYQQWNEELCFSWLQIRINATTFPIAVPAGLPK